MANHPIHLGVTGLRRTGKTVFLTSLIYQLQQRGSEGLSRFDTEERHLRSAEIHGGDGFGRFPYSEYLNDLRHTPPQWPSPTETEYQTTLTVGFEPIQRNDSAWVQFRRRLSWGFGEIELHLHDYPGEYLLDVEMVELSFDAWSRKTWDRMKEQIPTEAGRYVEFAKEVMTAPSAEAGDPVERTLAALRAAYATFVRSARTRHLEMIQPGISLAEWKDGEAVDTEAADPGHDVLPFVPLPPDVPEAIDVRGALSKNYDRYVEKRVKPFVARLRRCGTQIVLVDVLRVLRHGIDCHNDTRDCLRSILNAYAYTNRFFSRGISQAMFVATKADHALCGHRRNLQGLLDDLVQRAKGAIRPTTRIEKSTYVSAIRSTTDVIGDFNGRPVELLRGIVKGEEEEKNWNPGIVPDQWPDHLIPGTQEEWIDGNRHYHFPDFTPPRVSRRNGAPIPNIRLDDLIWFILNRQLG